MLYKTVADGNNVVDDHQQMKKKYISKQKNTKNCNDDGKK